MRWITWLVGVWVAAWMSPVSAITIEQAYATIHSQRAVFDPSLTTMGGDESWHLDHLFRLIDLSVKERVETLLWIQSGGREGDGADEYESILQQLHTLQPPQQLAVVHQLVLGAIEEQRDVLREWRNAPERVSMHHPLVLSSSGKLHEAYNRVMQLYPQEDYHNRQAFYDYFCCLDFI